MSLGRAGRQGHRQRPRERGAAAVEAAIVTPVVLGLLFGIIELGFLFKDYLAAAGAVRAGVRIASASPRNATFAQTAADRVALTGGAMNFNDVQRLWVYKVGTATDKPCIDSTTDALGHCVGRGDFNDCVVCVKFHWDGDSFVMDSNGSNGWLAADQRACSTATERPDRIGVYVQLKHEAFTGLVFKTVNISEASVMSLEPISFLSDCKP